MFGATWGIEIGLSGKLFWFFMAKLNGFKKKPFNKHVYLQ